MEDRNITIAKAQKTTTFPQNLYYSLLATPIFVAIKTQPRFAIVTLPKKWIYLSGDKYEP